MSKLFLTEKQIGELLGLAQESPRDFALLHLAASTALRGSDVLKIKREDVIDHDGLIVRVLRVRMKKTGEFISRPLRDDCRAAIMAWLASRTDRNPYLFCAQSNHARGYSPMTRMSYHRILKFYLEKMFPASVLQGCSTHTLRRSLAKLVYKKAGRIEPASMLLGHRNPANTLVYIDALDLEATANGIVKTLQW
jgi:integrase